MANVEAKRLETLASAMRLSSAEKVLSRCHQCDGKGLPGGCPRCGLTPRSVTMSKVASAHIATDLIPTTYQCKSWAPPELDDKAPLQCKQFDESLQKVHDVFLKGELPTFSMFIAAPSKYGKMQFAYSCLQAAIAHGFSVAPLMISSDWRRIYRVSQTNPMYKLFGKYRWDDLITKDVVFLSVDDSDDRFDVIGLLKTLYDTRAMQGLPTFIISDYMITELVPRFNASDYNKIYNPDPGRDYLRYPVILHRFATQGESK